MKAKELRAMDEAALNKELNDLLHAHFKLRVQKATQQLQNTNRANARNVTARRAQLVLAQKAAAK